MVESLVQHFECLLLSPDEKPEVACVVSLNLDEQTEIACVASLAHHRLLRSVNSLILSDVNLSSIPVDHLVSLVSCVTESVNIGNVSSCDLSPILDSLQCKQLDIESQSLNTEETQALVRAMETGVEDVSLSEDVTVDIKALTEYSGQGKCTLVRVRYDSYDDNAIYDDALRIWKEMQEKFERRKWTLTQDTYRIELKVEIGKEESSTEKVLNWLIHKDFV